MDKAEKEGKKSAKTMKQTVQDEKEARDRNGEKAAIDNDNMGKSAGKVDKVVAA